jgi:hypothetical protein
MSIAITQAAYDAICATLPLGSVGYEAEANERGERVIWLEDAMADRLLRDAGAGRGLFGGHPAGGGPGGRMRPIADAAKSVNRRSEKCLSKAMATATQGKGSGWRLSASWTKARLGSA